MSIGETLEKELQELINRVLDKREKQITRDEVKKIIRELIPIVEEKIDDKVSSTIRNHMRTLAQYILDTFKEED